MPGAGGILSLDLALTTGVAYGCLGERPVFTHWLLGKMADGGAVYARLVDELQDAIRFYRPKCIAYEAPLPTHRKVNPKEGSARQTNDSAMLLIRMGGIVEMIAYRHGVQVYFQHAGEARRAVLGKAPTGGSAVIKPVIISWAKSRGWDVGDHAASDDQADALLLLSYATVIRDRTNRAHFNKHGEFL